MSETPAPPADPGQLRKLREEQAKLTGTWINNVAVATFALGVLQPVVAGVVSPWSVLFVLTSFVLHLVARGVLAHIFPKD